MTHPFTRREKAFFLACLYLGAMFVSVIVMWWLILVGSNPITHGESHAVGSPEGEIFYQGDLIGVKRTLCTSSSVMIQYFPSIQDSRGDWYLMPNGVKNLNNGCSELMHTFDLPSQLPPGDYTYFTTVKYQSNLVGRDESIDLPAVVFRVIAQ